LDPVWNPGYRQLVEPNIKNVVGDVDGFDLDGVSFDAKSLMR